MAARPIVEDIEGVSIGVSHFKFEAVSRRWERTHGHNVASNIVAEREVASDCNQKVSTCCGSDTGRDNGSRLGWGILLHLVENREHLGKVVSFRSTLVHV